MDDDDRALLRNAMDIFVEWSDENDLQLNQRKTYSVSYIKRDHITYDTHYYINNIEIENVPNIVDLGLTMDSELTFKPHFNSVLARIRTAAGAALRFSK